MTFTNVTRAEMAAIARERFKTLRGLAVCRVARWLLANLTDGELRGLFQVTVAQLPALKARLQAKVDALTAAEAAQGE